MGTRDLEEVGPGDVQGCDLPPARLPNASLTVARSGSGRC